MIGLGIGVARRPSSGGGAPAFDVDAAAFFARVTAAGGTLSVAEQTATNQLVLDMKSAGIWSAMRAVYPMVGASAAACAQNLKSSSFTGTFTSGWTFASTGVTPNGTSAYMSTGLSPSATFASINSVSIGAYLNNTLSTPTGFMGSADTTVANGIYLIVYFADTSYNRMSSNITQVYSGIGSTGGFFQISRINSTEFKYYKNSSLLNTATINSSGLTSTNFDVGRTNYGNTAFEYGLGRYAFVYLADGFTTTEVNNLNTAVQAFQTTLSRQV